MPWHSAPSPRPDPQDKFEPYYILPRNAPPFDPRFTGYGSNKATHALEVGW